MKRYWGLVCITVLGFLLRFYLLGDVPVGFHRDEAFLGYNAYSLLKTGQDMTGKWFPLHFEAFLYSPGGYSYAAIPFIFLFGLSEFSVRCASAFWGSLSIPLLYFVIKEVLKGNKDASLIGVLSALFLAISPWHINLSRTATEHIVVVFLFLLGCYAYLRSRRVFSWKKILVAFVAWSLTLATYQSPRAFLPIFLPIIFLLYPLQSTKKRLITWLIFVLCIVLPVVLVLVHPVLSTRMRTVSVFSTPQTSLVIAEQLREDGVMGIPPVVARLMHNKVIGYTNDIISNFAAHLSYDFLFTDKGFPERYRVPHEGLLLLFFLPSLLAGCYVICRNDKKLLLFLAAWIGLGIFGSALTFDDVPNLQRTVIILPAYVFVMSVGTVSFLREKQINLNTKKIILFVVTIGLCIEFIQYMHHYYVQQIVHKPWVRHEGYKEVVDVVNRNLENGYTKAVITNRESAPAIFFLFYGKYDPATYIQEVKNSPLRDFDRVNFGPYEFVEKDCPMILPPDSTISNNPLQYSCDATSGVVYVHSLVCDVPPVCGTLVKEVKRRDGTRIFGVVTSEKVK